MVDRTSNNQESINSLDENCAFVEGWQRVRRGLIYVRRRLVVRSLKVDCCLLTFCCVFLEG